VSVAKILELVGSSKEGWEDAAQVAITGAAKTVHGIRGLEITDLTARAVSNPCKIEEYRLCVKLAFSVER